MLATISTHRDLDGRPAHGIVQTDDGARGLNVFFIAITTNTPAGNRSNNHIDNVDAAHSQLPYTCKQVHIRKRRQSDDELNADEQRPAIDLSDAWLRDANDDNTASVATESERPRLDTMLAIHCETSTFRV